MSSTMFAMKASAEAGSAEKKRAEEKRRSILVLIHSHLIENGYVGAAETLSKEAGVVLGRYEVADNMDIGLIVGDYEAYYEMRFDKKPKLVRKLKEGEENVRQNSSTSKANRAANSSTKSKPEDLRAQVRGAAPGIPNASSSSLGGGECGPGPGPNGGPEIDSSWGVGGDIANMSIVGVKDKPVTKPSANSKHKGGGVGSGGDTIENLEDRVLKPPPQFGGDAEMKQLAAVISREIYVSNTNVTFDDIVALDNAKSLLFEAVQLPLKFPFLFSGLLRPWKGILLHGPPGTGKTLLARAVAAECKTTFFNISASTLVSKWRGDSEKLVRALFELARYHAPSTVFLDEIDSILGSRGGGGDGAGAEHEASRRMKTELLIQMDGMGGGSRVGEQVFVMAASNLPWDLDTALLRRLEKRVCIPLPTVEAREAMLKKHLELRTIGQSIDFNAMASRMDGYSGADLELVCREAAMRPVRRLVAKLQELEYPEPPKGGNELKGRRTIAEQAAASSVGGGGGGRGNYGGAGSAVQYTPRSMNTGVSQADVDSLLAQDPVSEADIMAALASTRPSSDGNMVKYTAWQNEFGAV